MAAPFQPYTREEIERAIRLHDQQGMHWSTIAQRLGRGQDSLEVTVSNFKKGKWQASGRVARSQAIDAQLEEWVREENPGVVEMSRRIGLCSASVSKRLALMGLDAEMRAELHQEHQQQRMAA